MSGAIFNDHLCVYQRLAAMQLAQRCWKRAETFCPIETTAREEAHVVTIDAHLDAVAVELDFVQPVVAIGRFRDECRKTRIDEIGKRALDGTDERRWGE